MSIQAISRFLLFVACLGPVEVFAACTAVSQKCLDATPCKTINGVTVCLKGVSLPNATSINSTQSCWQSTSVYSCDNLNVNTCQSYINQGCSQIGSTCNTVDPVTGACALYDQTYSCFYPAFTAYKPYNDCAPLEAKGCTLLAKTCIGQTPAGAVKAGTGLTTGTSAAVSSSCEAYTLRYSCKSPSTNPTMSTTQCGPTQSIGHQTFEGFTKIATAAEAVREAGQYMDSTTKRVFIGFSGKCTEQLWAFGAGNCCSASSGAANNHDSMVQQFATSLATNPTIIVNASRYTYDLLFSSDSPAFAGKGLAGALGSNSSQTVMIINSDGVSTAQATVSNTPTCIACVAGNVVGTVLGQKQGGTTGAVVGSVVGTAAATYASAAVAAMYTSATATATGSAFGLTITAVSGTAGTTSYMTVSFDPWSLALMVMVMMIMQALSCPPEMAILQEKLGQRLCHEIGQYCSNSTIGGCSENTRAYCCFNSRLSRIINEQGRSQVGKSWGTPQAPNCEGFTTSELQSLNFDKMDLTEFMAEITANLPNEGKTTSDMTQLILKKYKNAP